jgi:LPS-assembly protein
MPRRRSVGAEEHVSASKPSRPFVLSLLGSVLLGLGLNTALAAPDDACLVPQPSLPAGQAGADAPVQLEADSATFQPDRGQTLFEGNARLSQPGRRLDADRMTYHGEADLLEAEGDVHLQQNNLLLDAARASYRPKTGEGELEQARYALPGTGMRGTAEHITLGDGQQRIELDKPSYTTCPSDTPVWAIVADSMVLDRASGRGTAEGASLQIGGTRLPGLPAFSFPIDNRRHSGFLPPSIGYGDTNGVELTVPYYFNLAPNYDLTLAPRLMSRRGILLNGEFRFLTPSWRGELQGEYLPVDRIYAGNDQRGSLRWLTDGRPLPGWRAHVDVNYASDPDYLSDLGNNLASIAERHLERTIELSHLGSRSALALRVQNFQTIDTTIPASDRPYSRLPQLIGHIEQPLGNLTTLSLDGEYAHFDRDTGVTGQRFDLQPALTMRWENAWSYISPRLAMRYTDYRLKNTLGDTHPSRSTHSLSLDAGMFFERPVNFGGMAMTQTLEPRLYYLYVPYRDQSTLPVFDTDRYDFGFDGLFRENRFSGPDRVGDANHLTLALSSRLLEQRSGAERLRFGIGQTFYFQDRNVTLPGDAAETATRSALVAGFSAIINPRWRLDSAVQWEPDSNRVTQSLVRIGWNDGNDHHINAGYRLRQGDTEQADIAGSWRLNARTSLVGRWTYSLRRQQTLEALAGIEYGSCCWKVRALLQHYLDDVGNDANTGILLQLELRGLGRLGKNIDSLMSDGLAGYRPGTIE